jgi:hypothetical protein
MRLFAVLAEGGTLDAEKCENCFMKPPRVPNSASPGRIGRPPFRVVSNDHPLRPLGNGSRACEHRGRSEPCAAKRRSAGIVKAPIATPKGIRTSHRGVVRNVSLGKVKCPMEAASPIYHRGRCNETLSEHETILALARCWHKSSVFCDVSPLVSLGNGRASLNCGASW